jgi:hypothetical protein
LNGGRKFISTGIEKGFARAFLQILEIDEN